MNTTKVNIRGVHFDCVTLEEAADTIVQHIAHGEGPIAVHTPNAEIVQMCIDDPALYSVINSGDIIVPDGIGIIKAATILGTPLKERVPGIDLGSKVLSAAAQSRFPVFFLGGKPGVAEAAAEKLKETYPGLSVVGTHHGYFAKSGAESDAVVRAINDSGAQVLFVCLGAPVQEKWIMDNRSQFTSVKAAFGLGGSLDVYAGNVKRAPGLFRRLGCEWLYRLLTDPRRIGRMMQLPRFYLGTKREKRAQMKRQKS